jgi:hypothetical protein
VIEAGDCGRGDAAVGRSGGVVLRIADTGRGVSLGTSADSRRGVVVVVLELEPGVGQATAGRGRPVAIVVDGGVPGVGLAPVGGCRGVAGIAAALLALAEVACAGIGDGRGAVAGGRGGVAVVVAAEVPGPGVSADTAGGGGVVVIVRAEESRLCESAVVGGGGVAVVIVTADPCERLPVIAVGGSPVVVVAFVIGVARLRVAAVAMYGGPVVFPTGGYRIAIGTPRQRQIATTHGLG